MKHLKTILNSTEWLTQTLSTNDSYNIFLEKFIKIYDQAFPERKLEMKQKNLSNLWISKSLKNRQKGNSVCMKI